MSARRALWRRIADADIVATIGITVGQIDASHPVQAEEMSVRYG
jgi:hypothetical protein